MKMKKGVTSAYECYLPNIVIVHNKCNIKNLNFIEHIWPIILEVCSKNQTQTKSSTICIGAVNIMNLTIGSQT